MDAGGDFGRRHASIPGKLSNALFGSERIVPGSCPSRGEHFFAGTAESRREVVRMGAEDKVQAGRKLKAGALRTCGSVMRASLHWTCRERMGESELMLKGAEEGGEREGGEGGGRLSRCGPVMARKIHHALRTCGPVMRASFR